MAFHYFMRLPLQLVSLAVPATRITGTFQNNSVDGTSSALMGAWPGRVGGERSWDPQPSLGTVLSHRDGRRE